MARCKGNQFGCRHLTGLNLFEILCQFVLCRALAKLCKAERESVKQQQHQAFSRHNVQLTRMTHQLHEESRIGPFPNCPTVLDETVKRRLVDVWATKICQVFVDLAEAQNPKGQFNRPNMTKLSGGPGRCDFLKTQKPYLRPKILILRGVHPQDPHGLPESFRRKSSNSIAEVREDQVDGTHDFVVQLAVDLGEVGVPPLRVHLGQP